MKAVALDLDAVLGDTRPLWDAWLGDVTRRAQITAEIPRDRVEAAARLDELVGNWRALLERFAEEHAPVYLRPSAEASAALRRLHAAGVRLGAWTDAPEPLARVAAAHLGAARRLALLEAGAGARERVVEALGADAHIAGSREELSALAG